MGSYSSIPLPRSLSINVGAVRTAPLSNAFFCLYNGRPHRDAALLPSLEMTWIHLQGCDDSTKCATWHPCRLCKYCLAFVSSKFVVRLGWYIFVCPHILLELFLSGAFLGFAVKVPLVPFPYVAAFRPMPKLDPARPCCWGDVSSCQKWGRLLLSFRIILRHIPGRTLR